MSILTHMRAGDVLAPVPKQNLSDNLARRIKQMIDSGKFQVGDRLPTISEMAQRFEVGHPTLREALKKLETVGVITVRHGAGIFVGENRNTLFVSNPVRFGPPTRKTLLDLVEARMPVETTSVALAAEHATPAHLDRMTELLATAAEHLEDDAMLNRTNMAYHRQIALASGNSVLAEVLDLLTSVFQQEQRAILRIYGSRDKDHAEHVEILEALKQRDRLLATERMRAHLEGVRQVLLRWDERDTDFEWI